MNHLILTLAIWLTSSSDADALRRTSPAYLDALTAHAHLAAARVAGAVHRVDPYLLLAIAYRESRYELDAVTHERSGKLSCGQMQITMPKGEPCPAPALLEGYLAGAAHLAEWRRATRSERDALLGYAGGYGMVRACHRGRIVRERGGLEIDLCSTPEMRRAAWTRRERARPLPPA